MSPKLRRWLTRIERLASFSVFAIPAAVALSLGFVWLVQNGWIFHFVFLSSGLALLALGIRLWKRRAAPPLLDTSTLSAPNTEWGPQAQQAYRSAMQLIDNRTQSALSWEEVQSTALAVLDLIASQSSQKSRSALSFTLPEALLLTEHVAARLRSDVRRNLPFVEQISFEHLLWLWRHRERGQKLWSLGTQGWRIFRAFRNPLLAAVQEIDRSLADGHSNQLTGEALALLQSMLLEEIARSATDLYFGHLRLNDMERDAAAAASHAQDSRRLAPNDQPLRLILVGQTSSGKSSLINVLLASERAETDLPPTTDRATSYFGTIAGQSVTLLDLPGLESRTLEDTLTELQEADLVIWVLKANRPAREPDRALFAAWQNWGEQNAARRLAPVIMVTTWVDAILTGWTPGTPLGPLEEQRLSALIAHIGDALGPAAPAPLPVSLKGWNLDVLQTRIAESFGDALMVQRNRNRLSASQTSWAKEALRAGRGLGASARALASSAKRRYWEQKD